jgi:hypothetical protein
VVHTHDFTYTNSSLQHVTTSPPAPNPTSPPAWDLSFPKQQYHGGTGGNGYFGTGDDSDRKEVTPHPAIAPLSPAIMATTALLPIIISIVAPPQ